MRRALVLAGLAACDTSVSNTRLPGATTLTDVTNVDGQSWFLVTSRAGAAATICKLVEHDLACSTIPNSAAGVALVEAGSGATPLLAIPSPRGTVYLEPFTWRTVRELEGVAYDEPAVILNNRTLWVAQALNVLIAPADRERHSAFVTKTVGVSLSPTGVLWTERRIPGEVASTVVMSAPLEPDRLGLPRTHPLDPWRLADLAHRLLCRVGSMVAVRLEDDRDAMFDLTTDQVVRVSNGGENATSWCRPDFVDDRVIEPERRGLGLPRAAEITNGKLFVYPTGEVVVLDRADRAKPIALRWPGMPFAW